MRKTVAESLDKKQESSLRLDHVKCNEKVNFEYQINTLKPHISHVVALVQKTAETKVRSDENAGRTLAHVQVTRATQTIKLNDKASGNCQIAIPAGVKTDNLEIIALLQNDNNGEIFSATRRFWNHN